MSDDSSDVDITEIGGIRDDRCEDGGPGGDFDAGIEWARGRGTQSRLCLSSKRLDAGII